MSVGGITASGRPITWGVERSQLAQLGALRQVIVALADDVKNVAAACPHTSTRMDLYRIVDRLREAAAGHLRD